MGDDQLPQEYPSNPSYRIHAKNKPLDCFWKEIARTATGTAPLTGETRRNRRHGFELCRRAGARWPEPVLDAIWKLAAHLKVKAAEVSVIFRDR